MPRPMPGFDAGTIVRVPFPYTDRPVRQHRPALVVSDGGIGGPDGSLLWVVMITSAANRHWPGDVALEIGHAECGLPAPSLIRTTKIATIDTMSADRLGSLDPERLATVRTLIGQHLGAV